MALIKWREYTSGQKSATQTNTAPRSAKMFKMWVDVPVMVTNTFREIPLSNIYRTTQGHYMSVRANARKPLHMAF